MNRYNYAGELPDFTEFLASLIDRMPTEPQNVQDVMRRFYIADDSARKDESGKVLPEDRDFYTLLQIGRAALDTIMGFSAEDMGAILAAKRKGLF